MRVRLALAAAAVGVATGGAIASAAPDPPPYTPLVTITHNNGGVQVGTGFPGQPLFGVSWDNAGLCVSFSYQVPFCLPLGT